MQPNTLCNISLHTVARRHAWNYFKLLSTKLLAPNMHPTANGEVPQTYVEIAATIFMDVWAADKSSRAMRTQQYYHAFTNPIFSRSELVWLPTVMTKVNQYLLAAHLEDWTLLDKDFSKEVEVADLVDSDQD